MGAFNLLGGKAQRVVDGYALTEENYPVVISLFKEKYGKPRAMVTALQSQIRDLSMVRNKMELTGFVDSTEQCLRQLEALNVDVNHPLWKSKVNCHVTF